MTAFTYAEVGATRHEPLPPRYNHLHYRTELGRDDFPAAAAAILSFGMHRGTGAKIRASAERAAPGVRLSVGLGPVSVPCEVVYALDEKDRAGFGYGTLAGHVASGEEAFLVTRDAQGRVWFSVTAFSRPVRWPMIVAGPAAVLGQRFYARACGAALKRLCARSRTVGR